MRRINLVLVLVLTLSFLSFGPSVQAQGGDAEAEINRLARAVHIQNLRTRAITRWVGGDLGELDGFEIDTPAGTILENFEFPDIYDETTTVNLSEIERPVLINVWASWCEPCVVEFPFLTEIATTQDVNFDLWFLNSTDVSDASARRFLRTQEGNINVYSDVDNLFYLELGIHGIPTTLLIDTDGTLLAAHSGVVTHTVMEFLDAVAGNPQLGKLNADDISEEDLGAIIEEPDVNAATEIVLGQQVAGEINDEVWQVNYKFEGEEGQSIVIEMSAVDEEMTPYLVLLGPNGERIAENLSGPSPPGALIETTLTASGTYIVVATRFLEAEGLAFGGYTLQISEGASPAGGNNVTILQPNIPLSGRLTTDRIQDAYIFSASEGEVVTFVLQHDTDEYLNFQVRIGGGQRIVPFTQTEEGLLEVEVTIPEDAEYSVYVSRPMSSREGPISYTLTVETSLVVEELEPPSDDSEESDNSADDKENDVDQAEEVDEEVEGEDIPRVENVFIEYGDIVTYSITNDAPAINYTFAGSAGDVITIEMIALETELDPQLILMGPRGAMFAANDDNGLTRNAAIVRYTLPMDGDYVIIATRYGEQSAIGGTGDFHLSLEIHEPEIASPEVSDEEVPDEGDEPTVVVVGGSIGDGDVVSGTVDATNVESRFTFSAEAGDKITVMMTATSGNLDTYISVFNSDGLQVSFNDDNLATANSDSLISNLTITESGTYTIVATRYGGANGASTGNFELELDISR